MKLADYLNEQGRGSASRLASAVGAFASDVSSWAHGGRPVPPPRCPAIESATEGKVARWDLRPDDWHQIWPELIGKPGAPAVAQDPETAAKP